MSVAQLLVRYSGFYYEEAHMATTAVDDRTAISEAVQLYIDGASKGDTAKLEAAFPELERSPPKEGFRREPSFT
jgi:hypothetical protein